MTTEYVAVKADWTAEYTCAAAKSTQTHKAYYIYVIDAADRSWA